MYVRSFRYCHFLFEIQFKKKISGSFEWKHNVTFIVSLFICSHLRGTYELSLPDACPHFGNGGKVQGCKSW